MSVQPNVLLFFTDQQRFDTIGALGNPIIKTPNLDRIARGGIAFTQAFSPSPVCVSARCSLHYGQYPVNTHCYENGYPMPTDGRASFVDSLNDAGYYTEAIGKRHFSPDGHAPRGFQKLQKQEEISRTIEEDDYMKFLWSEGFDHLRDPHGVRGSMYYVPQPAQMPARLHPTQWIGDRTVKFVEDRAADSQPWMLFSSFIHPHPPFAPPSPWHKMYPQPMMPLPRWPQGCDDLLVPVNYWQNRTKYRDGGLDLNLIKQMRANYYACISFIDHQIGRVLEALETSGQLENTLIIFTSDHGEHLGDYQCFGKRSYHDTAARVPMLVRLPGRFEGGTVCDSPASLVDVAPTILAAAATSGNALDGVDLADIASGAADRDAVFVQHDRAGGATYTAVTREWKYVYSAGFDKEFLFDRVGDPLETQNHANSWAVRDDVQARMKQTLIDFLVENGEFDALNEARDDFRVYPSANLPKTPKEAQIDQTPRWTSPFFDGEQ